MAGVNRRRWVVVSAIATIAFAVVAFLLSFWYPVGGDEGAYLYESWLLSLGRLAGIDFWVGQPPNFYLSYAIALKVLGRSIEAARVVSVISLTLTFGLLLQVVYASARRVWVALIAGVLFTVNTRYLAENIVVSHCVSNGALFAAFATLALFRTHSLRNSPGWVAAAGFCYGFAVNSRIPLAAAGPPMLMWVLWILHRRGYNRRQLGKAVLLFGVGALVASLFTIFLLLKDAQALWFSVVGYLQYVKAEAMPGAQAAWASQHRWAAFVRTWRSWYGDNHVTMWLAGLGGIVLVTRIRRLARSPESDEAIDQSVDVGLLAALIVVSVVGLYALHGIVEGYLNQVMPYLIVAATLPLIRFPWRPWSVTIAIVALLVAFVSTDARAVIGYYHDMLVDRRPKPSWMLPEAVNIMGARLAEVTNPGDIVLSWYVAPVFVAGRYLPSGMEQGFGVPELFWLTMPDTVAQRYHIITKRDLQNQVAEHHLAAIVDDVYRTNIVAWSFPEYPNLLRGYVEAGQYDGYLLYLPHGTPMPFTRDLLVLPKRSFREDLAVSIHRLLARGRL